MKEEIKKLFVDGRYPRASRYDPEWILQNQQGSHCLFLMESLSDRLSLQPGMRVLDIGCGSAIEAIFLAKEFGVQVWAVDLWADPTKNYARIREAEVEDLVFPLKADGRHLPFAKGFFDCIVGINSYFFFGTDDLCFSEYMDLLKDGGQMGMIMPGFKTEMGTDIPAYYRNYFAQFPEMYAYHSPGYWRDKWERTGRCDILCADTMEDDDGYRMWTMWEQVMGEDWFATNDPEKNVTFVRIAARKRA
jgi:SAM-dependent methyltransferase